MNTYLKGIKTVAVIFLSLTLFSCQDEQIEPIDTLSTAPDELGFKKGGNGGGGQVNEVLYDVIIERGDYKGTITSAELITSDCNATAQSMPYAITWDESDCFDITPTTTTPGSEVTLTLNPFMSVKKTSEISSVAFYMRDKPKDEGGSRYATSSTLVERVVRSNDGVIIVHVHKDQIDVHQLAGRKLLGVIGTISIGDIVYTPIGD